MDGSKDEIVTFMKTYLNNIKCYVRCENLFVEKSIESKCILRYEDYYGLTITSTLEYNSDIINRISGLIDMEKGDLTFDNLYYLTGELLDEVKKLEVQLGRIYENNIVNVNGTFDNNIIKHCKLTFKNGSICSLDCIEKL